MRVEAGSRVKVNLLLAVVCYYFDPEIEVTRRIDRHGLEQLRPLHTSHKSHVWMLAGLEVCEQPEPSEQRARGWN